MPCSASPVRRSCRPRLQPMTARRHCADPAPCPDTSRKRANSTFCTEKSYILPSGRPASLRNRCGKPAHSDHGPGHGPATGKPRPAPIHSHSGASSAHHDQGHTQTAPSCPPAVREFGRAPPPGQRRCKLGAESMSRPALHRGIAPYQGNASPKMHHNGARPFSPAPAGPPS